MKKGFTIVELLAVLAIMTIILLMAVPAYTGVVSIIHQRVYDSKITEVLAKSEIYSEETGKTVFNINALIEAGKIEADNESGVFEDPRDGRDMSCDMINVLLKDGGYDVTITEDYEKNCYDSETLENLHGITSLKVVKSPTESEEVTGITGTNWLRNNEVYVTYELKEDYKEYEGNIEEYYMRSTDGLKLLHYATHSPYFEIYDIPADFDFVNNNSALNKASAVYDIRDFNPEDPKLASVKDFIDEAVQKLELTNKSNQSTKNSWHKKVRVLILM